MREIRFRGKRLIDNEWIYGYFVKGVTRYTIQSHLADMSMIDVIPETVGQYTGLKDKNGIEIYEGDKVKAKFYGKEVNGEIGFSNGCFLLWNSCVSDNQLFIFTDIEVIGNIYENKLKEEGK